MHALSRRRRRRRLGGRQRLPMAARSHWQSSSRARSGRMRSAALLVDPADPSGNTVYAGTGEPNASGDSEAGLGICKSTDGGDSWTLVPGSDASRTARSRGWRSTAAGNLLVGIARGDARCQLGYRRRDRLNPTAAGLPSRGLYRQIGCDVHADLRTATARSAASTNVAVDPNNPTTLYSASFQQGVWRSTRQRRHLDADQVGTERRPEHRSRGVRREQASRRHDPHVRRRRQLDRVDRDNRGALLPDGRRGGRRVVHRHDDAAEHRLLHRAVLVRQRRRLAGRAARRRVPRRLVLLRPGSTASRTGARCCSPPTAAPPSAT